MNRRTLMKDTAPAYPAITLPSGITVTGIAKQLSGGYARHTYADAREHQAAHGYRLISPPTVWELLTYLGSTPLRTLPDTSIRSRVPRRPGESIQTYEQRLLLDMASEEWCAHYDALVFDGSDLPRINQGKWWVAGAPKGRAHLMGLWDGKRFIQPEPAPGSHGAHGEHDQYDYCTLTVGETGTRVTRRTVKTSTDYATGYADDIKALESLLARYGSMAGLASAVKAFQRERGLSADGIVGRDTWRALGQHWEPALPPGDRRAPACLAALRGANAYAPNRSRASDGIMGDAAHQARPSGHNAGNAVDITHDPVGGFACDRWAGEALTDPRTQYVIWNRQIANVDIQPYVWRPYLGSNPHTRHMHIEIKPEKRDDASPWAWELA